MVVKQLYDEEEKLTEVYLALPRLHGRAPSWYITQSRCTHVKKKKEKIGNICENFKFDMKPQVLHCRANRIEYSHNGRAVYDEKN